METNIKVEVHRAPHAPLGGAFDEKILPIYRIYIDQDLMLERDWIWSDDSFVDENLTIHGTQDATYTIRLECIKFQPKSFYLKNLRVNGLALSTQTNPTEVSFKLE